MPEPIGIGSTIWRFDAHRRVYNTPSGGGRVYGSLIWREHWTPATITGETSRSWIVGTGFFQSKCPKKGPHDGWAFTEEEVDLLVWAHDHRHKVVDRMRYITTDQLLEVAKLINYEPLP